MTNMSEKHFQIYSIARFISTNNNQLPVEALALYLNKNGYISDYKTEYNVKGRGVYRVISLAYDSVLLHLGKSEAHHVAVAFVNKAGQFAYEVYQEDSANIDLEASEEK